MGTGASSVRKFGDRRSGRGVPDDDGASPSVPTAAAVAPAKSDAASAGSASSDKQQFDMNNPAKSAQHFLQGHALFKALPKDFIVGLSKEMKPRMCKDADVIITKGEAGRAMFFIARGAVDVISDDGESVLVTLGEGTFVGEIALLFSVPRTATVRTKGRVVLLVLTKERLDSMMKDHPVVERQIKREAEERFALLNKRLKANLNTKFGEELDMTITSDSLKKVSIFSACDIEFLTELVRLMRPQRFKPKDYVIKKGDIAREMYFISKGFVQVLSDDDKFVAQLASGAFFGEIGVLYSMERTASVVAIDQVDLYILDQSDVKSVLARNPSVADAMQKEAKVRLDEIKRLKAGKNKDQLLYTELSLPDLSASKEAELRQQREEGRMPGQIDLFHEAPKLLPTGPIMLAGTPSRRLSKLSQGSSAHSSS